MHGGDRVTRSLVPGDMAGALAGWVREGPRGPSLLAEVFRSTLMGPEHRTPHGGRWRLRRLHFPARQLWRTRTPVKGQRKAEGGRFFGVAMKPASTVMGPGGGRPINLHDVVVRSPALPGVTLGCCRKPRLFSGPQ